MNKYRIKTVVGPFTNNLYFSVQKRWLCFWFEEALAISMDEATEILKHLQYEYSENKD